MTCIILASKVEESFEKIKTVLATAFLCLDGNSYQGRTEDIKVELLKKKLKLSNHSKF